jgi:hypothetical protein
VSNRINIPYRIRTENGKVEEVSIYFLTEMESLDSFLNQLANGTVFKFGNCTGFKNENLFTWTKEEYSGFGCQCHNFHVQEAKPKLNLDEVKGVLEITQERNFPSFSSEIKLLRIFTIEEIGLNTHKELIDFGPYKQLRTLTEFKLDSRCVFEREVLDQSPLEVMEELFLNWKNQSGLG